MKSLFNFNLDPTNMGPIQIIGIISMGVIAGAAPVVGKVVANKMTGQPSDKEQLEVTKQQLDMAKEQLDFIKDSTDEEE